MPKPIKDVKPEESKSTKVVAKNHDEPLLDINIYDRSRPRSKQENDDNPIGVHYLNYHC